MERVEVENVNTPGVKTRVQADKYHAMHRALLAVLPDAAPGMKPDEAIAALKPHLPEALFPGGATAGWWMKCLQLDLEAKGVLQRGPKAPVRLWKTGK